MDNVILKINSSNLRELNNSERVARYYPYEYLKAIVDDKLYFRNCELFDDDNERKHPERAKFLNKAALDITVKIHHHLKDKCRAYVSCWTLFDNENVALWKIYDKGSNGACVVTTIGKLKEQLGQDILINKVIYDEHVFSPFIDIDGVASNYPASEFFKIKPYFFEEEVRAVFYSKSHEAGIFRDVDFVSLVDEVYLSPFASDENKQTVKKLLLSKLGEDKIKESIISETKKTSDSVN